jgi:hypothetical protein
VHTRVERFFRSQSELLQTEFDSIRQQFGDPGVKGANNEAILAEFVRQNLRTKLVQVRTQVIDSLDQVSDETDICVCNEYQPFAHHRAAVIAEGVDCVIQVKAHLTTNELRRAFHNCGTVKRLERRFLRSDRMASVEGKDSYAEYRRIPYVVFAYRTKLGRKRLQQELVAATHGRPAGTAPDLVIVMDRGWVFALAAAGQYTAFSLEQDGPYWIWFDAKDGALFELVRFLTSAVPTFYRLVHPLVHYTLTNRTGEALQASPPLDSVVVPPPSLANPTNINERDPA